MTPAPLLHQSCPLTPSHPPPCRPLLPTGPNGCGKSTLVRALCELHPVEAGSIQRAAAAQGRGAMFVPQRPLAAPGAALWQQICYPDGAEDLDGASSTTGSKGIVGGPGRRQAADTQQQRRLSDAELLTLLERVGLRHLLDRVDGSFEAAADWAGQLSPGELQRLAVARVLLRWVQAPSGREIRMPRCLGVPAVRFARTSLRTQGGD